MVRIIFAAILGAIAGLLAWAITAPMDPGTMGEAFEKYEHAFVFAIGATVGLALGALNGSYQGSKVHLFRGALIGLVIGAIGGFVGYSLGSSIVQAIFPDDIFLHPGLYPPAVLARVIGLTPMGAALGLVLGVTARSWRQALVGLVGGAIGAGVGSAVFDFIGAALGPAIMAARGGTEVGAASRAVYAVVTGLGIGLFTSLIQRATRTAWVRLILGRNEAKEWAVDAPNTFIGRNENLHIPLFGDPAIAPIHAVIQKHQGNYYLADCGSGAPTFVNGMPIQQVPLFSGALITVGSSNLEFLLRAGSAPQRASEVYRSQFATPPGAAPAGYQGYAQPAPGQPYPQPGAQPYPQPGAQPYPQPGAQPYPQPGAQPYPQPGAQPYPQPGAQPYPQQQSAPTPSAPTQVQPAVAPVGSGAIVALCGPLTGRRFEIDQPIEIGRDSPIVPLGFDTLVSRRHASLAPGPVGIVLSDLGSTNGTFVNDQRVQSTTLRPGDLVKMGVTVFRVE